MSKDTTAPIPLVSEENAPSTQGRLGHVSDPLDAARGRIDASGEGCVAPNAVSRPVPPAVLPLEQASACTKENGATDSEPLVADFMEPVNYAWTEAGFEARQALKRYSEQTHADY